MIKIIDLLLCDVDPHSNFYHELNQATVKCDYYIEKNEWWNVWTKWTTMIVICMDCVATKS